MYFVVHLNQYRNIEFSYVDRLRAIDISSMKHCCIRGDKVRKHFFSVQVINDWTTWCCQCSVIRQFKNKIRQDMVRQKVWILNFNQFIHLKFTQKLKKLIYIWFWLICSNQEVGSGPCQASWKWIFVRMINGLNPLTAFTESSILGVAQGCQSASVKYGWSFCENNWWFIKCRRKNIGYFRKKLHIGSFCWVLNSRLYVFSSYLRPHQLVQYANLTKVNFLD